MRNRLFRRVSAFLLAGVLCAGTAAAMSSMQMVYASDAEVSETDAAGEDITEEKVVEEDKAMGDSYEESMGSIKLFSVPSAPSGTVATGVDISYHNGTIDFAKLAKSVDFAIIRCGYGSDYTSQDDKNFATYVQGCVKYDIPFGVYLYSYANTTTKAASEAKHTIRLLETLDDYGAELSLPVFYDMEDSTQAAVSNSTKASIAKTYCDAVEAAGYETGIYANKSWWTNYLTDSYFNNVTKWVAQYNSKCTYSGSYSMWQCSSSASISGISGNTDLDYMLDDIYLDKSISDASVSSISSQTYTGSAIKPSVTVKYGSTTLTKGTDYTVSYSNNTNVGTATVTITGKGNYSGTKKVTFKITARAISSATVSSISDQMYTGSAIKPSVTVKYNSKTLTSGTDYTVSYSNNTNVGTATVTITGKGNFTGTTTKTFKIVSSSSKKAISSATVSSISSQTYTGSAIKPSATVKYGSTTLKSGTDYTVSYSNNTNVGTATVTITGKGNYTGTKKVTFKITARAISSATVSSISNQTYTGSVIKPSVTVKYNSKALTSGTDYTVSYSNNKNPGKATVTITGKGNFTGTTTKTFIILPKAVSITSFVRGTNYLSVYYGSSTGSTGMQVAYRVKGTSTWYYTGCLSKYTGCKITGLKSGKTYEVKVRPYVTVSGTKYYGSYSSVKTATTK